MAKAGGWLGRVRAGLARTREALSARLDDLLGRDLDQAYYDELEEILLRADLGVGTTEAVIARLREHARAGARTPDAARAALREILVEALGSPAPLVLEPRPAVILVLGVNGTGKTTTIGKLAHRLRADSRRVLLAAADTFRAAAADQLTIWAQRAGVDIVKGSPGADPASVAHDACERAKARGFDVLIVDTAGRLHTQTHLMRELEKIHRVVTRQIEGAPHEVLLVLDATTGQNAIAQAENFKKTVQCSGIILAKLDGTAKGGAIFAIKQKLGLPVKFVGVGEKLDDLEPFDPDSYVEALFA